MVATAEQDRVLEVRLAAVDPVRRCGDASTKRLLVQPGNRQPPSRASSARRSAAGIVRVFRPTSIVLPRPSSSIGTTPHRTAAAGTLPRKFHRRARSRPRGCPPPRAPPPRPAAARSACQRRHFARRASADSATATAPSARFPPTQLAERLDHPRRLLRVQPQLDRHHPVLGRPLDHVPPALLLLAGIRAPRAGSPAASGGRSSRAAPRSRSSPSSAGPPRSSRSPPASSPAPSNTRSRPAAAPRP